MELQCLVRFPADTDDFLRQAQAVIAFGKQRALRGVYLCPVFTGEVYHCVAYLGGMNTFASGKEHPFRGEVYSGQVTRRQRENKCVRTNLNGIFNLRFVSEPDNGIYDAMNKGIAMAQGKFALFLNSGDIFHQDAANFVRKLKMQKDNVMITGDALLDFGDGHKIKRSAKPGWYIYHSLPASHQAIFFPVSGLKKWRYDLEYKVSSDYALAAKMYKAGYAFKKLNGLVSEFSMGGVSTTNNMELCADAKKVQRQILHVPGFWAELSWHLRQRTTSKTKALYNKV